jgi:hypothetical protein
VQREAQKAVPHAAVALVWAGKLAYNYFFSEKQPFLKK